jgi:Protein of unknown function (DUF2971).
MDERVDTEFFRELFALRDALDTLWRADEPAPPDVLYHYTSAAGAAGILRSQVLWATITSALNDETEVTHGAHVLAATLSARAGCAASPEEEVLFSRQLTNFDYTRDDILHVFAASLSEHEDDRPQWELYADHGYGIALGFDGPSLSHRLQVQGAAAACGLGRVIYDEKEQAKFVSRLVDEWFARARRALQQTRTRVHNGAFFLAGLFSYLATCAYEYFPMLKNTHFASEAEWRLAHAHDPSSTTCCTVKHRGIGSIAYVELPLAAPGERMPLVSLWLGPGIATDESRRTARTLLDELGYQDVEVKTSTVPLRLQRRRVVF